MVRGGRGQEGHDEMIKGIRSSIHIVQTMIIFITRLVSFSLVKRARHEVKRSGLVV